MSGILILSARVGAGHIRAAQAIEHAFLELGATEVVHHVETLDYTTPLFCHLYTKVYVDTVNTMPALYGWYYNEREKWAKQALLRPAFQRFNSRPFIKLLEDHQPDITVCTHPMPAEIISWLIREERLTTKQAVVVTDFDIHVQWLCPNPVHYFVAIDEARAHLEALGIPPTDITVSGIPIDPVFSQPKDPGAMRDKHGLQRDATVILISAGGFGLGRVEELLSALLRLRRPAQVVALCGRNEELQARVEQKAREVPAGTPVTIKAIGYTTAMDEYMAAADLVVGKPGGLTMSEALARHLVFVVVNPIPGQEERNADHLLEAGAAIRCNNLPVLAYKIDQLLDDPARLARLRENVRRLARPRAAFDIVAKLRELQASSPAAAPPRERVVARNPWPSSVTGGAASGLST
jgi:processive 1,2-diacylglycerol beta-glucosyltransferase